MIGDSDPAGKTITELNELLAARALTSVQLIQALLARIEAFDWKGPELRSVLEINPEALALAAELDAERAAGESRGPLHGIPLLLKDNIDTADSTLTTAGSLALVSSRPAGEATVVEKLRAAGAIILGKANLSEWANFRSNNSTSGWSARGGQTRHAYRPACNPCGSSSGSAVAVAARFVPAALGTETDGSIVCPAHMNGVVGLKPTVGLVSRAGVIPIAHSQDTVGPFTRSVADAALLLDVLAGGDERDPATVEADARRPAGYREFLDADGLRGARIGVPRTRYYGYEPRVDEVVEQALAVMRAAGAEIIDPADIPSAGDIASSKAELTVLLYEFKTDIAAYLAGRQPHPDHPGAPIPRTLADLIAFNEAHAEQEMPHFGQELFLQAEEKGPPSDQEYLEALAESHRLSRREGIDAVLDEYQLDALVAPTGGLAWKIDYENGDRYSGASSSPAAMAGYPLLTLPAGMVDGLPVGMSFIGRAYSEPTLLRLAYAYEQLRGPFPGPDF